MAQETETTPTADAVIQQLLDEAKTQMELGLVKHVPSYMWDGIRDHIMYGRPTGHFLTAIFRNDLMGAFNRADNTNQRIVLNYCLFLHNYAPAGSYGSSVNYEKWRAHNGLQGLYMDRAKEAG